MFVELQLKLDQNNIPFIKKMLHSIVFLEPDTVDKQLFNEFVEDMDVELSEYE